VTVKETCVQTCICDGAITNCPTNVVVQCYSEVPPVASVTFVDCTGPRDADYQGQLESNPGSSCHNTITRTWTATDACGRPYTCTQTITVNDNTPPKLTPPSSTTVLCDLFTAYSTETTLTAAQLQALGGSASDNCGTVTVTVKDSAPVGNCPKVYTRTFKATDACGNSVTATQKITCFCDVLITDSLLCTLPTDLCSTANTGFRLLFTQDPQNFPCYKLTASNPGQFYYNAFYVGTPNTSVTFTFQLPYPWVTQGAQPIHAYDSVTTSTSGGATCLTPGTPCFVTSTQVTLSNYSPQAMGSSTTVSVTLTVPPSGFVYLNMHLDYGLKGTTGYTKDVNNNAIPCTATSPILVPVLANYTFTQVSPIASSSTVSSCNTFKKNPGVGGLVNSTSTGYEVKGANAVLKDAKGATLVSAQTDEDGWYILSYKYTGKATTFYVTVTPPGGKPLTQTVTLKANGYVEADFTAP
jgi:hypothetical protein